MKRKPLFNNVRVTRMMAEYSRHPRKFKLRDDIMRRVIPLIDAAISRKRMYRNRQDLRQDCALRVLQALPKYRQTRGSAFGFLWSVICNTCISQNKRLEDGGFSMDSDADVKREAEENVSTLDTPETRHILRTLSIALRSAFTENGFQIPNRKRHQKASSYILAAIASGEFFQNRGRIVHRLKRLGLKKQDAQFYLDYTLVVVRRRLMEARDASRALDARPIGKVLPEESGI